MKERPIFASKLKTGAVATNHDSPVVAFISVTQVFTRTFVVNRRLPSRFSASNSTGLLEYGSRGFSPFKGRSRIGEAYRTAASFNATGGRVLGGRPISQPERS